MPKKSKNENLKKEIGETVDTGGDPSWRLGDPRKEPYPDILKSIRGWYTTRDEDPTRRRFWKTFDEAVHAVYSPTK